MTDDTDRLWRRDEIDSPCVKICMLHPETKLCIGCNRTGDEIARWSRMDPGERREIMAALPARGETAPRRRGGRSGRQTRG